MLILSGSLVHLRCYPVIVHGGCWSRHKTSAYRFDPWLPELQLSQYLLAAVSWCGGFVCLRFLSPLWNISLNSGIINKLIHSSLVTCTFNNHDFAYCLIALDCIKICPNRVFSIFCVELLNSCTISSLPHTVVNVYVLVSLVVLYRMFAKGPLPASQNNFVRFDNERDIEGQLPAAGGQQQQHQLPQQQQPTALNRS